MLVPLPEKKKKYYVLTFRAFLTLEAQYNLFQYARSSSCNLYFLDIQMFFPS